MHYGVLRTGLKGHLGWVYNIDKRVCGRRRAIACEVTLAENYMGTKQGQADDCNSELLKRPEYINPPLEICVPNSV
jgi:hypothetical protein